jgi:DNA repair ATPase RecN
MYITTVEVENYRAFRQAVLRLPQYGLVMVAGANNAGKSSLLSGLDVLAGSPDDTAALRHAGTGGPIRVTGTFSLADDERAAVLAAAPDRDQLLASGAVARLQFVLEERQGHGPGLVEVRGEWPGATMPPSY